MSCWGIRTPLVLLLVATIPLISLPFIILLVLSFIVVLSGIVSFFHGAHIFWSWLVVLGFWRGRKFVRVILPTVAMIISAPKTTTILSKAAVIIAGVLIISSVTWTIVVVIPATSISIVITFVWRILVIIVIRLIWLRRTVIVIIFILRAVLSFPRCWLIFGEPTITMSTPRMIYIGIFVERILLWVSLRSGMQCPSTWSHILRHIRIRFVKAFIHFKFFVSMCIKNDSPPVSLHLLCQRFLVDMYSTQIWLLDLAYIHKWEHGTHTFSHAVVAFSGTSCSGLAITCDNVNTFHRRQFFAVSQVGNEAFFEPPAEGSFASTKREEVQVKFEPLCSKAGDFGIESAFHSLVEDLLCEVNLRTNRIWSKKAHVLLGKNRYDWRISTRWHIGLFHRFNHTHPGLHCTWRHHVWFPHHPFP